MKNKNNISSKEKAFVKAVMFDLQKWDTIFSFQYGIGKEKFDEIILCTIKGGMDMFINTFGEIHDPLFFLQSYTNCAEILKLESIDDENYELADFYHQIEIKVEEIYNRYQLIESGKS